MSEAAGAEAAGRPAIPNLEKSEPSDRRLLRAVRKGSPEAVEALIERHWDQAHRIAYGILGDDHAAEDVTQEAMLSVLGNIGRFDPFQPFDPWLHRIVSNRALDWARARARRAEVLSDDPARSVGLDPALEAALAALSPEHRAVIVLRFVAGYGPKETGRAFGIPTGNGWLATAARFGPTTNRTGGLRMDESAVKRRLETLVPPNLDSARERAKLAARMSLSHANAPAVTGASHRRLLSRRNLALSGAVAAVAAGILIAIGSGGGSAVRPEVADAADLTQLGAVTPHLQLLKDRQIVKTEVLPEGGLIQFRFEGRQGEAGVPASGESEIQWHSASPAERGEQLESEGFTFAGLKPTVLSRPHALAAGEIERFRDQRSAHVYVSHEDGRQWFDAVGLWEEDGKTLEYHANVPDFDTLERLMERIEVLNDEEWLVALQPGGGSWLTETGSGTIEKVEKIKIGEKPNGGRSTASELSSAASSKAKSSAQSSRSRSQPSTGKETPSGPSSTSHRPPAAEHQEVSGAELEPSDPC